MAGYNISVLAFAMAMEVITRVSKWVVDGERLQDDSWLFLILAYVYTSTPDCSLRTQKVNAAITLTLLYLTEKG